MYPKNMPLRLLFCEISLTVCSDYIICKEKSWNCLPLRCFLCWVCDFLWQAVVSPCTWPPSVWQISSPASFLIYIFCPSGKATVWRLWPLGVVRAQFDPSLYVKSEKGPCTCNCSWNTLRQGLAMFWHIVLGHGRKLAGGETQMLSCELIAKGTRLQTKTTSLVSSCTRCVVLFVCRWLKWAKSGSSGRSQRAQTGVCSSWEQ